VLAGAVCRWPRQLEELALAESVASHAAWAASEPSYFEGAEAERTEALSA
jgi:hypothetical protein